MDITQFLRPEVAHFEPYLPGKSADQVKKKLKLRRMVRLSANENALGTSAKVVRSLRRNATNYFRYPCGSGTDLRAALAQSCNVSPSQVILGSGSDELIELLGKTFFNRQDEVVVSQHAFLRYKMAAEMMGSKTLVVPMRGFAHDLTAMAARVTPKTKALFVANPNNPTGTYAARVEVKKFFADLSAKRAFDRPLLVVFDEAYYEFSRFLVQDYPDILHYFKRGLNVMVLRTFSKIYGLAGLRVGYGIARADIVSALDRVRPPYNVSTIAQQAALWALADQEHVKKSVLAARDGLKYLAGELAKMGLSFVPSAANFLMVATGAKTTGKELCAKLLRRGILVRSLEEYGYDHHFRVTVGRMDENRFFIQKLKEVLYQP